MSIGSPPEWADSVERVTLGPGLEASLRILGDGPLVVLLHGFPDHARTWRRLGPDLASAGYRVLAPTLRGYEASSATGPDHRLATLVTDLDRLLEHTGADRVHLVGHDWGAAVAYAAAAKMPYRVASITAIAVSHPRGVLTVGPRRVPSQLAKSWYMAFFQLRGIAERALARQDWSLVARLWRRWSPGYELPADEWSALVETLSAPGVARATLGYYRDNLGPRGARQLLGLRAVPVPTLGITGADDGCQDTRLFDLAMPPAWFPAGLRVERLPGAGHWVHLEAPDAVARTVGDWLAEHPA